jgi:8-oxo-dGTP pyrophosphatase MutT (NUDIX family)
VPAGLAGSLNAGAAVTPRSAASVLMVDQADRPWKVLMMRRPGGADFAPGAYVFPGGSLHVEDAGFEDEFRAAAIRELFEEVGILLARLPSRRFATDRDCLRLRSLLADGRGWPNALGELGLTLAMDRLVFLARWITPAVVSRRFDTRFYVARRPSGQTVHAQPGEVTDWTWITPAQALEPDGLTLVHATRRILQSVTNENDIGRLIARLRRRAETPPVMPRVVRRPDGGFDVVDDLST